MPAHPPSTTKEKSQPGVFGQMAATAGGVAVGSAVGHAVGRAVSGMFGGGSHQQDQRYEEPVGPCAKEIKQFLDCAATHSDINLCQGFNDAIKACKEKNNIMWKGFWMIKFGDIWVLDVVLKFGTTVLPQVKKNTFSILLI